MKISVILPTRGRTEVLKTSLMTLLDNVKEPNEVEIILGMDEDDTEVIEYVKETLVPLTRGRPLLVLVKISLFFYCFHI